MHIQLSARVLNQAREGTMQDFSSEDTARLHDYLQRMSRNLSAAGTGSGGH